MVRWQGLSVKPVGGWEQLDLPDTETKIRLCHTWTDNDNITRTAILCEGHLYVLEGEELIDISPTVPLVQPTANILAGGYGDASYNLGDYGDPRPDQEQARGIGPAWSLDNWGEKLLAMSSYDGRLLIWTPNVIGNPPADTVTDSPTGRCFVVTPEHHIIIFGVDGNFRQFGWCSRDDETDWNFADPLNTAGAYDVEPSSPIIGAKTVTNGVLMFTALRVYLIRFVGLPYIYNYDPIASGSTPITAQCIVPYPDGAVWPSEDGFWTFDGNTVRPLNCDLLYWLKDIIDKDYARFRMAGMTIGTHQEAWWFFPEIGQTENSRCIYWNYVDGWWSMGKIRRTSGFPASYTTNPIMTGLNNIYYHERGTHYHSPVELPYAETSVLTDEKKVQLNQVMIDQLVAGESTRYTFKGKDVRNNADVSTGLLVPRTDGYVDMNGKFVCRDLRMRVESAYNGAEPWSMGKPSFRMGIRGNR
jgi:hypothetical protein